MPIIHQCAVMIEGGAYIEQQEDGHYLTIIREATEEDLMNNHLLECVGDTIQQVTLEVSFCPYCGKSLQLKPETVKPDFYVYDLQY